MTKTSEEFKSYAPFFRDSAKHLCMELHNRFDFPKIDDKDVPETSDLRIGFILSMVVLRALATEHVLKSLALSIAGEFQKCHNLVKLYEDLGEEPIDFIEERCKKAGLPSMRRVLKDHQNDFESWRYSQTMDTSSHVFELFEALDLLLDITHDETFKSKFFQASTK